MKSSSHHLPLSCFYQITQNFFFFYVCSVGSVANICTRVQNSIWGGGGVISALKIRHIKRPFITTVTGQLGDHNQGLSMAKGK